MYGQIHGAENLRVHDLPGQLDFGDTACRNGEILTEIQAGGFYKALCAIQRRYSDPVTAFRRIGLGAQSDLRTKVLAMGEPELPPHMTMPHQIRIHDHAEHLVVAGAVGVLHLHGH
ncbi:hypothetical protein, partial [Tahibacter harae]